VVTQSHAPELRIATEQVWQPPVDPSDDALAPARGIVRGLLLSLVLWALIIWLLCSFL
jgi:hypothetical protein